MPKPPRPGRKYTAAEMEQMRLAYPNFQMPGYVIRAEGSMFSFVRWNQATGGGFLDPDRPQDIRPMREFEVSADFGVDPIKKRTPQERLDSLTDSFVADCMKAGTIPGLSEEKVAELVGRAWKRGQPLTAEDVRAAAASLLKDAEARYEAAEAKKVVRTAPSD